MSSIGTRFGSFKHTLKKENIFIKISPSFFCPAEYNYIPVEDWRKQVANRLLKEFEIKLREGKELRAKYIYIHRVSRKEYAGFQEELVS